MPAPSLATLAWILASLTVALTAAGLSLMAQNGTERAAAGVAPTLVVGSVVGAIVVGRQPRNATGWLLLGNAIIGGVSWFVWEYGYRALVFGPSSLPLGKFAFWFGSWIWVLAPGYALPALLVRLPDGRRPRGWGFVEILGVVASIALALSLSLMPGLLDPRVNQPNPFPLIGAESWLFGLRWIGYVTLAVAISGALAAMWQRVTHATGDEREQVKWIASAAALCAVALIYGLGRQALGQELLFDALTPFFVSTVALPLAIGIAILKYRLYDIDLVISRTLVYGGLTAMLAGLYTFFVALTQRLVVFSGQKSDLVLLLTAFVGAAAFTPVKNWLQKTVETRFAVHDPASVVDSIREQIEVIVNVLDAKRIARRLVEDAASIYQARFVALALGAGDTTPVHTWGDASAAVVLKIVLHSADREVGVLSLADRRGGAAYTPRDQKALQQCADALGEAISLWEGAAANLSAGQIR